MPDSYDPELALAAQAKLRHSLICFSMLRQALLDQIPVFNEHEQFATRLDYDRRTQLYELTTLPD
jgi:hypothetical protein